uniref:Uncharacterized protein n=1 Tax=Setaria italica TaxID=4555 RepID=K3XUM5_SETIT
MEPAQTLRRPEDVRIFNQLNSTWSIESTFKNLASNATAAMDALSSRNPTSPSHGCFVCMHFPPA